MIESNPIYKYVACCICQSKTTRAHRLPALSTNEDKLLRYAKWVNFAAIENVYNKRKYYWICEIHFEDNAFCNHLKLKILRTAVPTLNPPIYEGPSTENGSPPGPTEQKDETLKKILKEVINRQRKIEPSGQKRRFYNFVSTSSSEIGSATISKENENILGTDIQSNQQTTVVLKQDSKQALVDKANDASLPSIKTVFPSPNFKTSEKPTKSPENPGSIEKSSNGPMSSSFTQRTRPLILKKSLISSKMRPSTIQSTVGASDLFKTLSNVDACPNNPESGLSQMKIVKKISYINTKKRRVVEDHREISDLVKKPCVDKIISTPDTDCSENLNLSSVNENISETTDSSSTVANLISNEKDEQSNILSTVINNSDISFSEISCVDEEVVIGDTETENDKQNQSMKYVKKQIVSKKKYYDPVLINSVLNKMKLKKNGPVCVVTLEKKPDRLFKGFTKSKLVTLYKQQINKNRKNKKANQGINKNGNDITKKKIRKKRRCTCSIHCHRRFNASKTSSPIINNVNSGVGVKFEGTATNPNVMNIDPDLADEELFNVENVFNVSTILTNVHDKSQIEQLCQMLIESIFRLKSLNIEGTMAKLQVYIAQVPEIGVNKSPCDGPASTYDIEEPCDSNNTSQSIEVESNNLNCHEVILSSLQENDCNQISSYITLTNEKDMPLYDEASAITEVTYQSVNEIVSVSNHQPKPKNVKVRLSTFHDHSYVKQESNYIFEKPEYLVKLINIETYRCPRKTVKPPQSGISKKEVERHKKVCLKLNNRIMHLRELVNKKNKNIKSMHRKIKYLGGIVCQEKGIKRVKYPKIHENLQEKQMDSLKTGPEEQLCTNRKDEAKILIDVNVDQLRMDNVVSINSFDSTSFFQDSTQIKTKKAHGSKTKKNSSMESFDVLYENLIEELCCNEMQY
ncbi:uncharacterized protein [Halyomorpha halys]|uniref:uncharacterized protein n=1 Tax=Halyomorpha halys TaxID=286706 RepID=UPI0006D52856|nr:uncharacterized protein LOC106689201 [Halyomorpha halys]